MSTSQMIISPLTSMIRNMEMDSGNIENIPPVPVFSGELVCLDFHQFLVRASSADI